MMTNDELDLLASSYLDGEATPDEVALVEADPELRARVEQLRSVRVTAMAAPPGLAQAQLAQAMAAYGPGGGGQADDESTDRGAGETEAVIDLTERRRQREGRMRWLTSAAAVLVVGVGAVTLISRMDDGDDAEMATADVATEATEAAEVSPAAEADTAGADEVATTVQSEMAEETEEAGALADLDGGDGSRAADAAVAEDTVEAADAEEELALDEAGADDAQAPSAERVLRDLPESGFFPDEPVAVYNRLPIGEEMVGDLELPWRDEGAASCLEAFPADDSLFTVDEVEVIAYLPFEVTDGDDAGVYEALYVIANRAEEVVVVLRSGDCTPVSG